MRFIDKVEKEIKSSGEEELFTGRVKDEKIAEFETLLGIFFPNTYKDFLRKYGALSFCGDTYYGITQNGENEGQIPCVLFSTQQARAEGDISDKMINIKSSGYGPSYAIDTEIIGKSGEAVIVEVELSFKRNGEKKIIADSYGDFILEKSKSLLKIFKIFEGKNKLCFFFPCTLEYIIVVF